MANHHTLIPQVMGIKSSFGYEKQKIRYQCIIDNVSLLMNQTAKELNNVIVAIGHKVSKKA